MEPRRIFDDSDHDDGDQPDRKRMRSRPSFAAVIGEVVKVNSMQNLCSALEPVLRRVVNEEVVRGLGLGAQPAQRSPQLQIKAAEASSTPTLQLCFTKKLSHPVFTGSKIEDEDGNPLQIILTDHVQGNKNQKAVPTSTLPFPIKVEIVALDGDFFNDHDQDFKDWTSEHFNDKIVRERAGKRPLITGDVNLTLRNGQASIGALTFTDNSSWIRSRTFRLGARVVPAGSTCDSIKIREALSEPFIVKDHRGESYKKHHPPSLGDEVWRLEKIGKDGAFHKRLDAKGIKTVQDLLKLWVVDRARLRSTLGNGMSDKVFEAMIKHAKTCFLGNKHYVLRRETDRQTIIFNPICQVVGVMVNGKACSTRELIGHQRVDVEGLIKFAYANWSSLGEVDGQLSEDIPVAPPGNLVEAMQSSNQNGSSDSRSLISHQQLNELAITLGSAEVQPMPNNAQPEYDGWQPQYSPIFPDHSTKWF